MGTPKCNCTSFFNRFLNIYISSNRWISKNLSRMVQSYLEIFLKVFHVLKIMTMLFIWNIEVNHLTLGLTVYICIEEWDRASFSINVKGCHHSTYSKWFIFTNGGCYQKSWFMVYVSRLETTQQNDNQNLFPIRVIDNSLLLLCNVSHEMIGILNLCLK